MLHEFETGIRENNIGLIEYEGKLFGNTISGGANNDGYLFSYEISTGIFNIEHEFDHVKDGGAFLGEWLEYDGVLYGASYTGGLNGYGTLVSYDIDNGSFTVLEALTLANGRAYKATPILWDDSFLSIDEEVSVSEFKIYPNPANTFISIGQKPADLIQVYSISGKLLKQSTKSNTLQVSDLAPGVYLIRVKDPARSESARFVKE